jgi:hypothetical protein
MRRSPTIIAVFATVFAAGCGDTPEPFPFEGEILAGPATSDATGPRLSTRVEGELILSWMERGPDGDALLFSDYRDGEWQQPRAVINNVTMFVNWADLPSVVPLGDGRLFAHWLVKRPGGAYAYDVVISQSPDDGDSWLDPISPHSDGTPSQHGFV